MANPFVHVELMSTDVAKAKSFYGKLFDWTLEDMPMPRHDLYDDQGWRRHRWRADEKSDSRRALDVDAVCPGR